MAPVDDLVEDNFEYYSAEEVEEMRNPPIRNETLEEIGKFIAFFLNFSFLGLFKNFFKYIYKKMHFVVDTYKQLPEKRGHDFRSALGRPIRPFFTKKEIRIVCYFICVFMLCFLTVVILDDLNIENQKCFREYINASPDRLNCMNISGILERDYLNCTKLFERRVAVNIETMWISYIGACASVLTGGVGVSFFIFLFIVKKKIESSMKDYHTALSEWFDSKKDFCLKSQGVPEKPKKHENPVFLGCLFLIAMGLLGYSDIMVLSLTKPTNPQHFGNFFLLLIDVFVGGFTLIISLIYALEAAAIMCWFFLEYHMTDYQFESKYDIYNIQKTRFIHENRLTKLSVNINPRDPKNDKKIDVFVGIDQNNQPYIHEITNI